MVLIIRQLRAPFRILELSGQCGPLSPVTSSGRQRGGVQWYPGGDEAVALMLGGSRGPVELRFDWRRESLSASPPYVTVDGTRTRLTDPRDLVEFCERLVDEGVECTYERDGREVACVVRSYEREEGRSGVELFSLEIEPLRVSRPRRLFALLPNPLSTVDKLRRAWDTVLSTARRPFTLARSYLDASERAVAEVNSALRRTSSVVEEARAGIRTLDALSSGVASGLTSVMGACESVRDAVDAPAYALAQSNDAKALLEAGGFSSKTRRAMATMRRRAVLDREAHAVAADPRIMGEHIAAEDENLRLVAARWYGPGRVHLWQEIAAFNQLPGSRLAAGQRILIPVPRGS